jgi:serine/threonine protein kinase/tetratricopeptide (TPR) repeat protein
VRPPLAAPGPEAGLAKGATIGRYVVLGLLGRGGMGEVYAAYDPELDRKVTVKLLRARGGTSRARADGSARLLREAQAIARLSHPNVVVVYDVGTFQDSVFIAMEFVEGHTLGYWLAAQPRRWREVLDVFMAAGRGLGAAHAAGLVHRDFKPDNVMITKGGQVRVMDFGLAREQAAETQPSPALEAALDATARAAALAETADPAVDPDATAKLGGEGDAGLPAGSGGYLRIKLTQTGAVLGTPAYMAPEQFAGAATDARTDQFSFSVALYEGLYGHRPFAGQNALALMASVVSGTIVEPPAVARVPTRIRKILLRGIATRPADRYPSMAEMLAALADDPAARRRRWLALAAGAACVATAAVGLQRLTAGQRAMCAGGPARAAASWNAGRRGAMERAFKEGGDRAGQVFASAAGLIDKYVARWAGMYQENCEATNLRHEQSSDVLDLRTECLGERLQNVSALTEVLTTADRRVVDNAVAAVSALPTLDRCSDVAMLRAVIKPPDNPIKRAAVAAAREEVAKVRALADSGRCDEAIRNGDRVREAVTPLGYPPLTAEAFFALGRLGDSCIDARKAIEYLEEAVLAAEASRHDEIAIEASVVLGGLGADRRVLDARTSWHWVRLGEAILRRFPGHPLLEAWTAVSRAIVLRVEERFQEALDEERRALALKQSLRGDDSLDVATSTINVALDLHELGRDREAEPLVRQAVNAETRLLGPRNAGVALALLDRGEILTGLGRYGEANSDLQQALSIWRETHASPYYEGYGLLDLGRLQVASGAFREARLTLERSSKILHEQNPELAAEADLAMAQALWASPKERPRALHLALQARDLVGAGSGSAHKRKAIEDWLRLHDRPPS